MTIYVPGKVTLAKEFTWNESVWNPSMLSTALWLDAADASTITESGGAVSQWNDKSGNSRNAVQSTAGFRPVFSTTGLNSRQSINFDGTDDRFDLPTGFLNGATEVSMAFVLLAPLQNNDAFFGPSTTNSVGLELICTNVASWPTLLRINGTNKITTGLWSTNSQPTISTLQANSVSTAGWLNGLTVAAASATGISALNFNGVYEIGCYNNNTTGVPGQNTSMQMNLAELVITVGTWSTDTRQRIEGYLAHKWGLTANLPAGHPYKLVGPTP